MRVGIIGCGLIGRKRAEALADGTLVACADTDPERARALASHSKAFATTDWRAVTDAPELDLVVVATPHDQLAPITLAAVRAGKHVLVEKPAARSAAELAPVIAEVDSAVRWSTSASITATTARSARRANSSTAARWGRSCSCARATVTAAVRLRAGVAVRPEISGAGSSSIRACT
jgi:predicted dinucleotide-utilizing enzyme